MTRDLTPLFFPRSVAVIGASSRPDSLAGAVVRNLIAGGFAGDLAAVHPDGAGFPGAVVARDVDSLPFSPDLAIWGVPWEILDRNLPRLLGQGTRAHVILSAGFSETGAEGAVREGRLVDRVRAKGGVLLGPNCMGFHVARADTRLDATFSRARPAPGRIALLAQSGSVAEWLLLRMAERGLGAALAVSAGNMADLDLVDLLEAVPAHFPEVRRVLLYVETIPEAARLRAALAAFPPNVQVLALAGGTTQSGARAVAGHTGALAAEPALAAALLDAVGIVPIHGLSHALDTLEVLEHLDRPRGRRVVVVTNAGGPGVLLADALEREGFTLPALAPGLQTELRKLLPSAAVVENPVDLLATAAPALFERSLRILAASGDVDLILPVFMHPVTVDAQEIASAIVRGLGPAHARAAIFWLAGPEAAASVATLRAHGIPVVTEPGPLAAALATWADMPSRTGGHWPHERPAGEARLLATRLLPDPRGSKSAWGDPVALEAVLAAPLHRVPPHIRVESPDAVADAAANVGYPLVLKIESACAPHKAGAGLLAIVRRDIDLVAALATLRAKAPEKARWLVQRRVPAGPEVYVGFLRHPHLGAFVGFAMGGAGVELRGRAAWIAVPSGADRVQEVLHRSPVLHLLGSGASGPRGGPAGDAPGSPRTALTSLLQAFAHLAKEAPELSMAEVNPAIWDREAGAFWLVDCRWSPRG